MVNSGTLPLQENEYRQRIQEVFDRIQRAFADVDPDVAECEESFGSLTIRLSDGSRCILSAQPSVRQLWLAVASKGVAFHFNYMPESASWVDDKGRDIELLSYLQEYLKDFTGLDFFLGK